MRVVHVVPSLAFDRGGPTRSVAGLATAQAALGARVAIVSGGKAPADDSLVKGVEIRCAPRLPIPFEIPGPKLTEHLRTAAAEADIVHLHSVWNGTTTAAESVCSRLRKPFLLSPRGVLDAYNVRQKRLRKACYLRLMERRLLGRAAGWHFLDDSERRGCSWLREMRTRPWAVIPNGVDIEGIQSGVARAEGDPFAPYPSASIRLVYLGRLHPIKNLALQVRVVARLHAMGLDARLYLVGPDDGARSDLEALARGLGVAERVVFVGPIYDERRFALLRDATAVLLTSHYDCNSRTAAEAMTCGGYLLASRQCHMNVACAFGAAVVLPADEEAFAGAVARSLTTPEAVAVVRRRAMEFSRENLPWSAVARRMVGFYEQILGVS